MENYQSFLSKAKSEKVTLAIIEAVHPVKLFSLETGSVYSRVVDHFVSLVSVSGVALSMASGAELSPGEFYFSPKEKKLFVRMLDDSNPKTKDVAITYKFFFSSAPYVLPCDLGTGEPVEFEPRIDSLGSIGSQLDDQSTGIVLESSSSISFENNDGYWDEIFDKLIWENQSVKIYSWGPSISISEAQKIFDGLIESKDFSPFGVRLSVRDFVFRLKSLVNLPLFSELDGKVTPSMIGKPKRRVYGQVQQLRCEGFDKILGGFELTGAITTTIDSQTVTGSGTLFLSELSPGDEIIVELANETAKFGVESIESDTSLTIGQASDFALNEASAIIRPEIPYRKYNRRWSIAGHKLREPSSPIIEVINENRVRVDSSLDMFSGDSVKINDEFVNIRRVSGNKIVLNTALVPAPEVGDLVTKNPVSRVFFGKKELFIDRDWTLENSDEATLVINELAEFNIAEQRSIGVTLIFTNGSREVTTSATVDLRTILKPRDWIRKNIISETAWYEILSVKEQGITLRTTFTGSTSSSSGLMKNVDLINDDSQITVDCMGLEHEGEWIKTPSDAVKHLVTFDSGFLSINEASFAKAKADCEYILSLPVPLNLGESAPKIKDVIAQINESVFGSLYGDSSWDISYSILNSQKPDELSILRDDDILSFDVVSTQNIISEIKLNYRPFTDLYTGENGFRVIEKSGDFVDRLIGIKRAEEVTVYLYEEDKAEIMAQRILFFRSLSTCKVQVKTGLNLATKSVNDKLFLDLNRLYKRYGGGDRKKVGVITSVKKDGSTVTAEIIDLGNVFNRVPSIAPNNANHYDSASEFEKAKWGYILDSDTLTPNVSSELELGNNLIG